MMNRKKKIPLVRGIGLALLFFVAACSNPAQNESTSEPETDSAAVTDSLEVDTNIAKFTDQEVIRVVAGNSIGDFLIDQEVEESNLFNRLGEVDSADAAMCKSWSMWYLDDDDRVTEFTQEFDVYAACDADIDMKKSIQVMRLSNVDFSLDNGISLGTDLAILKETYPEASEYIFTHAVTDAPVKVYDDVATGVAFELTDDEITAVIVHSPEQSIENMYLPFFKNNN